MRYFGLLALFIPLLISAQVSDSFSDGDFTNNPTWIGNTNKFIVNASQELQLFENPQAAGTSYLSTASGSIYDASWEFLVQFDFNPSSTNYCDVYLTANTSDLSAVSSGYFVRLGNTSDEVSLYRKNPTSTTEIIDGTDARLNTTSVNVRVKVNRDLDGNWTLLSDTLGGFDYYTEGTTFDNTYISSAYFGFLCVYTSTRSQHMFFDDIVVTGEPFVDDVAPELLSYQIIDNQNIILIFSEDLEPASALNTNNYNVNNGIGQPADVSFYLSNPSSVLLVFENGFISPNNYTLQYQNIRDLSLNVAEDGEINFSYLEIEPGMIIVNEIMADPDPPVGLPNAEYVELYNTSFYPIDLSGWTYKIGTSSKVLNPVILNAGEYLILCHENFVSEFTQFGNVLGIASFPLITNGGQTITIFDNNMQQIDLVTYSDTWYKDSNKKNGGWSLEKIDPLNTCSPQTNWIASNDEFGGTPGRINSVFAINNDTEAPYVVGVSIESANEISVLFSEPVDTIGALNLNNYLLNNDFGNPVYAIVNPTNSNSIILQFPASFAQTINYILSVSNISDLCGNTMGTQQLSFILYNPANYDVLICEIMADPEPVALLPNSEYIELYNSTNYDLDLSNWTISAGTTTRSLPYCTIPAGGYLVLCNSNNLSLFTDITNVVGVASFPALTNGGTNLTLRGKNAEVIHSVTYSDTWYKDNFKKNGGYSLEMIDLNNPCEGAENWIATNDISGGTPGRLNSVNGTNPDITMPYPVAAEAISSDTLIVYFNEILKQEFANNLNSFFVEEFGNPVWVSAAEPTFSTITMKFDADFVRGTVYYLKISSNITDCSGNPIPVNTSFRFAIADSATNNDIVINEILFNPLPYSKDFIELYNRSDKTLDLKLLWYSDKDEVGEIKNSYQISNISRLLLPGEYVAISTDIEDISNNYYVPYPQNLFNAINLPSMPDDIGSILLTDRFLNLIDEVNYNKSQHYKLLASQDGVSLERINFNRSSDDLANWHSASQTVGFATPGYQNSQFTEGIITESSITLSPEVFSPDNDGYDDRLTITYKLSNPGYTATMAVYNSAGKFITYITNNEMLGVEGNLYWDGFDNGNNICPQGIYILYVEMFSLDGDKIVEKHAVVLSKKVF
jgi:hypothetical protein